MNNQEAKFILGAYRPDGRDAADAMFVDAIAQAQQDPELRSWLERERKFDLLIGDKVRQIAPPAELRAAILAGSRASRRRRRQWWRNPMLLAAAAAIAVVTTLTLSFTQRIASPDMADFAAAALNDIAESHSEHNGFPQGLAEVQARLATATQPLNAVARLNLNLDELRRRNCRSVRVAGRQIFEICFERDGAWYHLYAARRSDFPPASSTGPLMTSSRDQFAAASWADSHLVYTLVATGPDALRRVI
jgi:hypothetical protein